MFVFKYFPGLESICLKSKYFQVLSRSVGTLYTLSVFLPLENRIEENANALKQYLKFIFWVHQFFCRYYALLVRMCTEFDLLISLSLYIKHSLYERKTLNV